jgi:hypothetical protein
MPQIEEKSQKSGKLEARGGIEPPIKVLQTTNSEHRATHATLFSATWFRFNGFTASSCISLHRARRSSATPVVTKLSSEMHGGFVPDRIQAEEYLSDLNTLRARYRMKALVTNAVTA